MRPTENKARKIRTCSSRTKPAKPEPKPKSIIRSLAARKPVPPARDAVQNQRAIRTDPVNFACNILGVKPWDKQQQILNSIAANRYVAVRSCNGAGKTFTAAVTILWWLMSYDNAIVITTAPSERQVREILWRELRNLYIPVRDIVGGKLTRTRLEFGSKRYAYGFSTNTEDRFQGFHSGNILVIVDEASGVDEFILQRNIRRHNFQKLQTLTHRKPARIRRHVLQTPSTKTVNSSKPSTSPLSIYPLSKIKASPSKISKDVEYPDPITDDTDVIPAGNTVFPARNTVFPAEAGTQGNINYGRFTNRSVIRLNGRLICSTDKGPNLPFTKPEYSDNSPRKPTTLSFPYATSKPPLNDNPKSQPTPRQSWASMSHASVTTKP